jgi:diaminohydroxyphosphoribosylaminopyrimidine deaminase / 5-amino-6-(5-phosphoribosylamino)uracil reductase
MKPSRSDADRLIRPDLPAGEDDTAALWQACLALAERRRGGDAPAALGLCGDWSAPARSLFDLYRPLLELPPGRRFVLGHLGQSLDGRIATASGDSCYVNGPQNLTHLHRLRALCDAVVVGAATVVADDPQLTTRLVEGRDATRVVLDPSARVTAAHRVCADPRAQTLLVRYAEAAGVDDSAPAPGRCGEARVIGVPRAEQGLDLEALLDTLASQGLHALLVEGGGITVSRFLQHGLLDRLQIAVAPLIIGAGRPGLQLAEVLRLEDCLRPPCRHFPMGDDVLFDLALSRAAPADPRARPPDSTGRLP